MSNCDQNCEAVANLNDYAANLIEYSKRIDKWVNGGQTEFVDVGGVSTPTLRNLAMSIKALMGVHPDNKTIFINQDKEIYVKLSALIQNGGGLNIDSDGKLFVDVSSMNTEVFEQLMASLRLPMWLDNNTIFYVAPNGVDDLSEGRGLIAVKPWKTIQFAVNTICDNYNMGKFTATIKVAAGIYNENVILGAFTATTGKVIIQGAGQDSTIINGNGDSTTLTATGGKWDVKDVRINCDLRGKVFSENIIRYLFAVLSSGNAELALYGVRLMAIGGPDMNSTVIVACAGANEGKLTFNPHTSSSVLETYSSNVSVAYFIVGTNGANITAGGTNSSSLSTQVLSTGSCTAFLSVADSTFNRDVTHSNKMTFGVMPNLSVTGIRYSVASGGKVSTGNGGENYFPGSLPGTVDATTYSWYR